MDSERFTLHFLGLENYSRSYLPTQVAVRFAFSAWICNRVSTSTFQGTYLEVGDLFKISFCLRTRPFWKVASYHKGWQRPLMWTQELHLRKTIPTLFSAPHHFQLYFSCRDSHHARKPSSQMQLCKQAGLSVPAPSTLQHGFPTTWAPECISTASP